MLKLVFHNQSSHLSFIPLVRIFIWMIVFNENLNAKSPFKHKKIPAKIHRYHMKVEYLSIHFVNTF